MIGYYIPHRVYPAGYHCDPKQPLTAALASQKGYMSVYLMCIYGHEALRSWFEDAWAKAGKKLNMGKSCVRFKKLDDLALDVIGKAIRQVPARKYIEYVESARAAAGAGRAKPRKTKAVPEAQRRRSTNHRKYLALSLLCGQVFLLRASHECPGPHLARASRRDGPQKRAAWRLILYSM